LVVKTFLNKESQLFIGTFKTVLQLLIQSSISAVVCSMGLLALPLYWIGELIYLFIYYLNYFLTETLIPVKNGFSVVSLKMTLVSAKSVLALLHLTSPLLNSNGYVSVRHLTIPSSIILTMD
jgi:hypothetical protein